MVKYFVHFKTSSVNKVNTIGTLVKLDDDGTPIIDDVKNISSAFDLCNWLSELNAKHEIYGIQVDGDSIIINDGLTRESDDFESTL